MDLNNVSSHKKLIIRLAAEALAKLDPTDPTRERICREDLLNTHGCETMVASSADTFEAALTREIFERD